MITENICEENDHQLLLMCVNPSSDVSNFVFHLRIVVILENLTWFLTDAPKQGRTSAVLSALISIFPSKGPHVVPTGSCCRLWIRRSPSLRKTSSSPENTPEPRAVSHSALYSTQVPHQIRVTFMHCPSPSKLCVHQSPAASCEG